MPSLKEYVLTLKKYNPKTEDRLLKIYLLKAGWPISDIETAFAEYNAGHTSGAPMPSQAASVAVPAPVVSAIPAATASKIPTSTAIEVAAPEIEPAHIAKPMQPTPTPTPTPPSASSSKLPPITAGINRQPSPASPSQIEIAPREISPVTNAIPVVGTSASIPAGIPTTIAPVTTAVDIEVQSNEPMGGFLSPFPNTQNAPLPKEPENALPIIDGSIDRDSYGKIIVPGENAAADSGILLKTPTVASIEILTALADGDAAKVPGDPMYVMPDIERDLAAPHASDAQNDFKEKISTAPSEHILVSTTAEREVVDPANMAGTVIDQARRQFASEDMAANQSAVMPAVAGSPSASGARSAMMASDSHSAFAGGGLASNQFTSSADVLNGMSAAVPASTAPAGMDGAGLASGPMMADASIIAQDPGPQPIVAPIKKKKSHLKLFLWLALILVLGALGYGYTRFVHGVYLFVNPPVGREEVLTYMTNSAAALETAEYTTQFHMRVAPREPGSESIDLNSIGLDPTLLAGGISTIKGSSTAPLTATTAVATDESADAGSATDTEDFLAAFPADANIDVTVKSFYQKNRDASGNAEIKSDNAFHHQGTYSGEGVTAKFDVESVIKGGVTYVKANEFPQMLLDIEPVKGKWISIQKSDEDLLKNVFPWLSLFSPLPSVMPSANASASTTNASGTPIMAASMGSLGGVTNLTKGFISPRPANADKQIARLISIADDEKVLQVIGDPIKNIQSGSAWYMPKRVTYVYKVKPDLAQFLVFIDRANTILQNEFGTSSIMALTDAQKAEINGPAFAKFFEYMTNNGRFAIEVDKYKALVGFEISINVVSETKRTEIGARISLDKINDRISIEAPKADLDFSDAYTQMTGQTREVMVLRNTAHVVEAIRSALAEYQAAHEGALPDDLMALLADPAGIKAFAAEPGLDDKNLLSLYQYKKMPATGNGSGSKQGYQLVYQIALPKVPEQFYELHQNLIGYDSASAISAGSERSLQYLKFVNGKNTATEKVLSVEAEATKRLDSDKDLITNGLEQYIGTNITKKDTDDDTVGDYDELQKGGNPNGPGSWAVFQK